MQNNDINGSSPNCVKFQTKRMGLDPLNPQYNFSKVEVRPITPPKYIKDQMEIDDIDGARPKKNKIADFNMRESMKINDIEGTKAKLRHSPR